MRKISELAAGTRLLLVMAQCLILMALLGAVLLVSAGKTDWFRAWLFLGVYAVCFIASTTILVLRVPQLIDERRKKHDNVKRWDKYLVLAYQITYFPIFVVSGLDERWGWSDVPFGVSVVGLSLFVASFVLFTWAPLVNTHLESYVRIQSDRNHTVCDTGPYHYIRHPAYSGLLLFFIGPPLSLGSFWALILSVVAILLLAVRTTLEDKTLQAELPGYREYAQRVRFKWVPGVW